jgi:LmbE family N-acetylglucosaminyl deacetylase
MTPWRGIDYRLLLVLFGLGLGGCGESQVVSAPSAALIVVSPHPDDESILGAATIHRLAADPHRQLRVIYMSSGDRATKIGPCNGIPEKQKIDMVIALRENEARAAWRVIVPDRDVPIDFLRGPDSRLVAATSFAGGVHVDTLSAAGQAAVDGAVAIATQLPPSIRSVLFMTTAIYDAHPDHRAAYQAARQAAEILHDERHLDVKIWSWIVHDEQTDIDFPVCCGGDTHWPAAGPRDVYLDLADVPPRRPRPPVWNHTEDVRDLVALRHDALFQHVSQVSGNPALCMPVYVPDFYTRWVEKTEEPFYEEVL